MPDAHTPNFDLVKPEVGASADTWGAKLNENADLIDAIMALLQPVGAMVAYAGGTVPAGWLLCDGQAVLASEFPKLFAVLGYSYGGNGTTTFAVPDKRGRVGMMAGSSIDQNGVSYGIGFRVKAGRVFQNLTLANMPNLNLVTTIGGDHAHVGGTSIAGTHGHSGFTDNQGYHQHAYTGLVVSGELTDVQSGTGWRFTYSGLGTDFNGAHTHNVAVNPAGAHDHVVTILPSGAHNHIVNLPGGGQGIEILPPYIGEQWIIFCGYEPAPMMLMAGAPEVGLMSLMAPAPAPRLLSSPMRGMG